MDISWDKHKDELRMLYHSGDRDVGTLKAIMTHMRAKHNFVKSKAQYERQFKKWYFHKNNTATEWKNIHKKIDNRQRQGKKSVVYQSGRLIQTDKVQKAKRHNFCKTEELFRPEEAPRTPEGFAVCTPAGDDTPHVYIDNLPSLQLFYRLQSLISTSTKDTTHDNRNVLELAHISQREPVSIQDISRVLHTSRSSTVALPLLHASSNNLLSDGQASSMMNIVRQSGNRSVFNALMSVRSAATKAIARTLLPPAIRLADIAMVRLLLETGISPDLAVDPEGERPLLLAIRMGSFGLTELFLDHGAQVNFQSPYQRVSPLAAAARACRTDLVRLLLDRNATFAGEVNGELALLTASAHGNLKLVKLLLDAGADPNARGRTAGSCRATPLQIAHWHKNNGLVHLLLSRGARPDTYRLRPEEGSMFEGAVLARDRTLTRSLLVQGHLASPDWHTVTCTSSLRTAASDGRIDLVDLFLSRDASDILPAMDAASLNRHMEVVRMCFEAGAKLDIVPTEACERMALRAGVRCGDYAFVQHLLRNSDNIDVDAPANQGDTEWTTSLQTAARSGRLDLVRLLIDYGADVNKGPSISGWTALQGAVRSGNIELVTHLLRSGADVNADVAKSVLRTPLALAAQAANLEIIRALLGSDIDVVEQGKDALLEAIPSIGILPFPWANGPAPLQLHKSRRAIEVVRLLLKRWVHPSAADIERNTILRKTIWFSSQHLRLILRNSEVTHLLLDSELLDVSAALIQAIDMHDPKLVELLLQSGAGVNNDPYYGPWPLTKAAVSGQLEILQSLLQHGANEREKARALQASVYNDCAGAVRVLIVHGADVSADPLPLAGSRACRTALQTAAERGNLALLQILLEAGAEVERLSTSPDEQGTALQFAAMAGSIAVVNELVQRGANVNALPVGRTGRTALEGAAEYGRLDMVQLLLNLEADTRGSRALQFARNAGHEGVVALLLENGFEDDFIMSV